MATLDDAERTKGFAPTTKITIKQHSTEEGFGSVNGAQPLADVTNRQTVSRTVEGKDKEYRGNETHSGAVVGMDSEDAERARSVSRGSESSEQEDRDDDEEVNGTQGHDHGEEHGIAATGASRTASASQRHSTSSSVSDGTRVPVLVDPRSRSSSSNSSSSTTHSHEDERTSPSARPARLSSSIDRDHPSHTDPTTVNSETASNRPQSATEFQKFRDHLHHSASHELFHNSHPTINELAQSDALHPNPHHPGTKTEILRIERVYTPVALPTKTRVSEIVQYDVLIPRFSPAYPRILGEYGIEEEEWGRFIGRVNRFCVEAFDPFRVSNVLVNLIALVTLWMSEWIMPNLAKRVSTVELWGFANLEITGAGAVY
jgi:Golgin subfamily A member 7/ERF4 family